MSEKPDPRTRLVAETFHDDWTTGPASTFARAAAAHARRRRAIRRTLATTAAAVAVLIAVFTFAPRRVVPNPPPPMTPPPLVLASKISPAYEIISDDELFATLRTRPLLVLPNEPADRRYVVLNRTDALATRH